MEDDPLRSLDLVDRRILNMLQEDGSITNVELARRLGLAPATTLDRVRKLRVNGYILKYVALLDGRKLNRNTIAFVNVSLGAHGADRVEAFRAHIQDLPEVLECYHVSGDSDFLLKILTSDIGAYENFLLTRLTRTSDIARIHTSFVLSTVKHETRIPIEEIDDSSEKS